ncbi:MAG: hypothetical protein ACFFC7_01875 [Candidatus Hermodarchaeota archaeon]
MQYLHAILFLHTVKKPISVESVTQIFASVSLEVNDTHLQNLIQRLQDVDISKVLEESLLPKNDPTSEVSPAEPNVLDSGSEAKKDSDEFDFSDLFDTNSDSKGKSEPKVKPSDIFG